MKIKVRFLPLRMLSLALLSATILSCNNNIQKADMLILVETPQTAGLLENSPNNYASYLKGARISKFVPGIPESSEVLTSGFFSACSPDISNDGRSMIFSAQQKEDGLWQIWEIKLDNSETRKIISLNENCTDPVYLPDGRIVFSKLTVNDTVGSAHCLFTCNPDGTDLRQITFSPADNLCTKVLKDGRLLTINTRIIPEKGEPVMMVLRPDGTKAELFYKPAANSTMISRGYETSDGRILFVEYEKGVLAKGNIVSISYNRPLNSRKDITMNEEVDFRSVIEAGQGKFIVVCRKSVSKNFSLYEYDPINSSYEKIIESDPGYEISGVMRVGKTGLAKKLPSEVDLNVRTGLLFCQDINYLNPFLPDSISRKNKAIKIEVLGIDTTYGIVNVEKDGSFQLKVMADRPFRIITLDEYGRTVNGPCSWMWLRPNERRGCIGCHEDPEMAPQNKVSMAVRKPPVMIPVHITEIKEKTVELE